MTSTLHAHISTTATDCDGRMDHDYVIPLNDEETAEHRKANGVNDFHNLHFKERVLARLVTFSPDAVQTITVDTEGITAVERTEEGYRHAQAQWCEDPDCDPGERSQRDHTAEAMGY